MRRLYALIDAGARLEANFPAAESDGDVIITRQRMGLDDTHEAPTPLRSTDVYVLDGDRILSITRVPDADQRHAMMREALVGPWQVFRGRHEGGVRYRWPVPRPVVLVASGEEAELRPVGHGAFASMSRRPMVSERVWWRARTAVVNRIRPTPRPASGGTNVLYRRRRRR